MEKNITNLLGLKDVIVKNIENKEAEIHITVAASLVSSENGKAVYSADWSLAGFSGLNSVSVAPYCVLTDGSAVNGSAQTYTYSGLAASGILKAITSIFKF